MSMSEAPRDPQDGETKGVAWPSPPPKYAPNHTALTAHTPVKSSTEDEANESARPETPKTAIKVPQQPQENGSAPPEARSAVGVVGAPLRELDLYWGRCAADR